MTSRPARRPVRVLVADDQPLLRHSLAIVIDSVDDLVVVGSAATGADAVTLARLLRPDVVLMDIRMPGGDGIAATRAITGDGTLRDVRVVVLTMFELDEYVYGALRAGASGFLLKDTHPDRLLDAVRRIHAGESLFAPSVLARIVAHYVDRADRRAGRRAPTLDGLTDREKQVLVQVAEGLSNDDIAQVLTISVKTVKTHIGNLLAKLSARDRAQLVIAAYESGLVHPRPAGRRSS
ncbi:response regulator transcription factor [Solwaraspora sp. WMMD792]|uniref:response regulator n=1 Tax=Solwaraspora sp. WMMD792 TaxID=3016099 RepID=UPI0024177371|nr:response regulator transcription factor [Solwaraspora sp. WMMD792]MDG4768722.1 response regulator transcription factor [Solwaraspora sp. WMMD792]MDG4771220.1 response regulator transcription factor [Solwaraspora sp. WMMD792]